MHAAPDSGAPIGQRTAAALLAGVTLLASAGCSTSSGDQAALNGPTAPAAAPAPTSDGPTVVFHGTSPQVAGHPATTAALDRVQVPSGCAPAVKRSDQHLVSVLWRCQDNVRAATVSLDGRQLGLGDILQGNYASYLSSVASAQFSVENQPHASTDDLSTWYLTPAVLAVAFPAGIVSYPLASLGAYLKDPSSL